MIVNIFYLQRYNKMGQGKINNFPRDCKPHRIAIILQNKMYGQSMINVMVKNKEQTNYAPQKSEVL